MTVIMPGNRVTVERQPLVPVRDSVGPAVIRAGQEVSRGLDIIAAELEAQQQRDNQQTLREARTKAIKLAGEARIEADQDLNFADLPERFGANLDEIGATLSEGLPEDLRESFDQSFAEIRVNHELSVRRRSVTGARQAQRDRLGADLGAITGEIAQAPDDATRAALTDLAADALTGAQANGLISAEEARDRLETIGRESSLAIVLRGLREAPDQTVADLEAGRFQLDPVRRERLIGQGKATIERAEARAARQAEQNQTAADRALARRVSTARNLLLGGEQVEDLDKLREAAAGTEQAEILEASIEAATRLGDFASMPPVEQLDALRGLPPVASDDPNAAFEQRVRNDLREMARETARSLLSDPLEHVRQVGAVDLPGLSEEDLADPAAVEERIALAQSVAERYGAPLRLLTDAERDLFEARIADGSPTERLAFAGSITQTFGDQASSVFREMSAGDPVFALSGQLAARGELRTAEAIFRGEALIKSGDGVKPSKADMRAVAAPIFTAAFRETDNRIVSTLMAAAEAHFAASGLRLLDSDGKLDSRDAQLAFTRSLQAVAGQTEIDGKLLGGFQDVNGRMTLLTPGLDPDQVETALSMTRQTDDLDTWQAASVGGGQPSGIAGPYIPTSPWLIDQGGGVYLVQQRRGGETVTLIDANTGGPFLLDLRKFVEVHRASPLMQELERRQEGQP